MAKKVNGTVLKNLKFISLCLRAHLASGEHLSLCMTKPRCSLSAHLNQATPQLLSSMTGAWHHLDPQANIRAFSALPFVSEPVVLPFRFPMQEETSIRMFMDYYRYYLPYYPILNTPRASHALRMMDVFVCFHHYDINDRN